MIRPLFHAALMAGLLLSTAMTLPAPAQTLDLDTMAREFGASLSRDMPETDPVPAPGIRPDRPATGPSVVKTEAPSDDPVPAPASSGSDSPVLMPDPARTAPTAPAPQWPGLEDVLKASAQLQARHGSREQTGPGRLSRICPLARQVSAANPTARLDTSLCSAQGN